jgi:Fur family peroxide stress response transcriptional regulator
MNIESLKSRLRDKRLKATPRRLLILEAIIGLNNHPTAEEIINYIRNKNRNIATATVYKALDIMVDRKVIIKVDTEKQIIRYDAVPEPHHHLYSAESGIIKDYENEEINIILEKYFTKNKILDFDIEEIKLQIIGKFRNTEKNANAND